MNGEDRMTQIELQFENITCTDSAGNDFEHYERISVSLAIAQNSQKWVPPDMDYQYARPNCFTRETAKDNLQTQGFTLPSSALTFALLEQAYERREEPLMKRFLEEYKDHGVPMPWLQRGCPTTSTEGIHLTDTVVKEKIVHYAGLDNEVRLPYTSPDLGKSQFDAPSRLAPGNSLRQYVESFGHVSLDEALKIPEYAELVQNVTGLRDPRVIEKIANLFGISDPYQVRVFLPQSKEATHVSLGAESWGLRKCFNINTTTPDTIQDPVRGYRIITEV